MEIEVGTRIFSMRWNGAAYIQTNPGWSFGTCFILPFLLGIIIIPSDSYFSEG